MTSHDDIIRRRLAATIAALIATAALVALLPGAASAAGDCLAPVQQQPKWSCRAELSNGQSVEYCLEHTHVFGAEPGSRFYHTTATGLYRSSCTCQAAGSGTGRFGEDAAYLCLDRGTDTVIRGKASKAKLSGETFNVSANVRSTFVCEPDPGCDVPTVVDADLPAEHGQLTLFAGPQVTFPFAGAGGDASISYLPGCNGYASAAPTIVVDLDSPTPDDRLEAYFTSSSPEPDAEGVLVMGPSGQASCADDSYVAHVPVQRGRVGVWVVTKSPSARVNGELRVIQR